MLYGECSFQTLVGNYANDYRWIKINLQWLRRGIWYVNAECVCVVVVIVVDTWILNIKFLTSHIICMHHSLSFCFELSDVLIYLFSIFFFFGWKKRLLLLTRSRKFKYFFRIRRANLFLALNSIWKFIIHQLRRGQTDEPNTQKNFDPIMGK